MPEPLHIVAIAGPSCAGKGTLAAWLAERLPASILPVDAYYRPLDHLTVEERSHVNFDEPASIDHELLFEHLRYLLDGRPVDHPIYDFSRHTRKEESVRLEPHGFLIVEGLFSLFWAPIRSLLHGGIYIEAPNTICLDRRVYRDQRERGRTETSVRCQYEETVQPMRALFVEPTRDFAGLVLDGTRDIEWNGQRSLEYVRGEAEKIRISSEYLIAK
ncbi:MAG: (d)CMP kinase [Bryobacterales bacterium]|nr:(d)CMP kinase [Bryobacterales bacterium]